MELVQEQHGEPNYRPCAGCGATGHDVCYQIPWQAPRATFHVGRCRNCGLVRLLDSLSESEYLSVYDGGSTTLHVADALTVRTYDRILDKLGTYRQSAKLLEVGIGGGSFIRRAAERGWTCYGNDVSNVGFEHLHGLIPPANLHRGFLSQARFLKDAPPFDAVVMLGVLEHVPSPLAELELIRSLLRPGGAIFIDVPNYAALTRRLGGPRWGCWDLPGHVTFFTAKTLEAMLEKAGFRPVETRTEGLNPFNLGLGSLLDKFPHRQREKPAAAPSGDKKLEEVFGRERVQRRRRIDQLRRFASRLGPTKAAINTALTALRAGDGIYCLAVASG